jgi:oligoribonuclease NrnB/cAMP/cGMP phosphodiesterase (DHH superfamily)
MRWPFGKPEKKQGPTLEELVRNRTQKIVHLTHNDLDAAGADAIHRRVYGRDSIFTVFSSVGRFTKNLNTIANVPGNGDTLSISDLGFQKGADEAARRAKASGWRIIWRDHHRWKKDEIERVSQYTEELTVDTSTCGCGLVARALAPDDPVSVEVARIVCDYDLWTHKDPRSAILGQIGSINRNLRPLRDRLEKGVFSDDWINETYAAIDRERTIAIRQSIRRMKIREGRFRIAFAPLINYPSETAAAIRDEYKTDIEVIISDNGRFSLRSAPPISHLIAAEFGGGGHPNASGGSFPFTFWDKVFFRILGRTSHFDRFVSVAEALPEDKRS